MKAPDLTRQYLGAPCFKGHDGWRYRKGGRCVECARILSRDRSALRSDALQDSRPARRDEFSKAIERASQHLYAAGMELWTAKDQGVRGWRRELARYGLSQRVAQELRRYVLAVGIKWTPETARPTRAGGQDEWLK
jgi:hypothetical protein